MNQDEREQTLCSGMPIYTLHEYGLHTYLDGHRVAGGPVDAAVDDAELARAENLVREYLTRENLV